MSKFICKTEINISKKTKELWRKTNMRMRMQCINKYYSKSKIITVVSDAQSNDAAHESGMKRKRKWIQKSIQKGILFGWSEQMDSI